MSIEEQFEEVLDQNVEQLPEPERFKIDSLEKADWVVRKIVRQQKLIDDSAKFVADRIEALKKFQEEVEASRNQEIEFFQSLLRPWLTEQLDGGKKKSVKLPSGTVSFRSRAPEFFIGTEKISGRNKKLTEMVSKYFPDYLKMDEYTDWDGLKKTLIVTKTGQIVNSDGEIIDWMRGVEYPDEIKAKGMTK